MIRLASGSATDVGQVRAENQDAVLVADELFAVADGMGGHRGGEVASAAALEALSGAVLGDAALGQTSEALVAGVQEANRAVFQQSLQDTALTGMGTTLVVLGVIEHDGERRLGIVNVGDSRAYVLAGDEFRQLSEDHSLVETMLRSGQLTEDEAANHPRRNVITRALGIEPEVDVDAWMVDPQPGDRFLLCSDGLFNDLDDEQLTDVLRRISSPDEAATELVRLANEAGGRDNISAVVIDVVDVTDEVELADGVVLGDRITRVTARSDEAAFNDTMAYGMAPVVVESPLAQPAPTPDRLADRPTGQPSTRAHGAPPPADHRWTWRVGLFVVAILAVVGIAFGAVAWTARSGYFIVAERGQIVFYQGHQGGLLWFEPTKIADTGILLSDLRPVDRKTFTEGQAFTDRTEGEQRIADLKRLATEGLPSGNATTTTVSPSTTLDPVTTTVPAGG